ncbi:MAG: 3-oxoadipate enol-lactonase [Burkholderiales bacterium]|nr:3-oxoadipate enol-lactonase [Burkholderiales bacterium]
MKAKVNGVEIHYTVEGEGPWLTLSHSLACDISMWDPQMAMLTRAFKVLRFDTRGHGGSETPAGDYTLEQMADDVHGLFAHLGIRRSHWMGLSMGGMIGQAYALKYPGVFESMILADTTSRQPPAGAAMWAERMQTARTRGMEPLVEGTLARWFTEPFRAGHPEVVARIGATIRGTPPAGYAGCCAGISKIDLTDRLKEIRCPTLVVVGEQDMGTPVEASRAIQANLPGAELVIIPSAAHVSNVEQPEIFNIVIRDFLTRVTARG